MHEVMARILAGMCACAILVAGSAIASGTAQAQVLPVTSGLRIWLDADDVNAGGATPANGAVITQWKDKSGNVHNAASTGTVSATYESAGLSGYPSVRFNPGAKFSHSNIFTGTQSPETTIFLVQAHAVLAQNLVISLNGDNIGSSGVTGRFGMQVPWVNNRAYFDAGGTSGYRRIHGAYPVAATAPTITSAGNSTTGHVGMGTLKQYLRIDGTQIAGNIYAVNPYVSGGFSIGAIDTYEYNGRISEVIVYDRALSQTELDQVECYLSGKWNITTPHSCTTPVTFNVEKDRNPYNASAIGEFAIPSNEFIYELGIEYLAGYQFDNGSMFIADTIPSDLTFYNGDLDGVSGPYSDPVGFANIGSLLSFDPASGLKYSNSATAPSSAADCTYTPTSGYDSNIKHVCITLGGYLLNGEVQLQYRVRLD